MAAERAPGPVDFVLIEFPTGSSTASTAKSLVDLAAPHERAGGGLEVGRSGGAP